MGPISKILEGPAPGPPRIDTYGLRSPSTVYNSIIHVSHTVTGVVRAVLEYELVDDELRVVLATRVELYCTFTRLNPFERKSLQRVINYTRRDNGSCFTRC